jgi:hypothetical protein
MTEAFDVEQTIFMNIQDILLRKEVNTKELLLEYYNNYSNTQKYDYSDIFMNACLHYLKQNCNYRMNETKTKEKDIEKDNVNWFITFCEEGKIIDYCNIGLLQRCLEEFYYFDNSKLYSLFIKWYVTKGLLGLVNDHLISFYTHPKYSDVRALYSIITNIPLLSIEKLIIQCINRKCTGIVYFLLHRYKKKIIYLTSDDTTFQKEDKSNICKIYINKELIQDYLIYQHDVIWLLEQTSICTDEMNIILDYLY